MALPTRHEWLETAKDLPRRLVQRFPRGVGLLLLAGAVFLVLAVLTGTIGLVIAFSFVVSPEASEKVFWLCVGISAAVTVPLLMLVEGRLLMRRSTLRLISKAQAGDKPAMWRLVDCYLRGGQGLLKDLSAATWWLQQLAEAGDSEAAFLMHEHLRDGVGIARSRDGANGWLRHAAALGHPGATTLLGDRKQEDGTAGQWRHDAETP